MSIILFLCRKFDVNNDGKLSADELKPALRSLGFNPRDSDVQVTYNTFYSLILHLQGVFAKNLRGFILNPI